MEMSKEFTLVFSVETVLSFDRKESVSVAAPEVWVILCKILELIK